MHIDPGSSHSTNYIQSRMVIQVIREFRLLLTSIVAPLQVLAVLFEIL